MDEKNTGADAGQNVSKSGTWRWISLWIDSGPKSEADLNPENPRRIDWRRCSPFVLMHVMCFGVFFVGYSHAALALCIGLYFFRMFAITGFYHRYFAHKSFKTSRFFQAVMAVWGLTAIQRGPLWWSAHHRHHHVHSDDEHDIHSPKHLGFIWSHMLWFIADGCLYTDTRKVRDLGKFKELLWLDRFEMLIYVGFAVGLYWLGVLVDTLFPGLGTSGLQFLFWGFFLSTILAYHGTYTINSLSHTWGSRRFATKDTSRNNFWLSLITMGEGWHNNHHHYPASTRQGFYWWEVDATYYLLKVLSWTRLIWDLNPVPQWALEKKRIDAQEPEEKNTPEATPAASNEDKPSVTSYVPPLGRPSLDA